jgi:PiT family inorganic phosphate transporter
VVPALIAPTLAFALGAVAIIAVYRLVGRSRPGPVTKSFRRGQIVSGGILALAHGTNDAQKTMGIITLALVAHGNLPSKHFSVPYWVVVGAASAIALGTYTGGWRIIRTMGTRIIRMDVAQGFTAQTSGAAVILAASHVGYPLSTTHVISGGIMGAGAAKRLSAVRWGVAGNIVVAWLLTLPAAGATAAGVYAFTRLLGGGTLGAVAAIVLMVVAAVAIRMRRAAPSAGAPPLPQST